MVIEASITDSEPVTTQDAKVQKIMTLWNELSDVRNEYSDCGAIESDADWKIQATLYAISFCVLVDVPKTSKRYGQSHSGNIDKKSTDTFLCRCSMNELILENY
jgi:hypothetical protein